MENIKDIEGRMQKSVDNLKEEYVTIRAGRANPHILDRLRVDYYGTPTPINSLANVTVPEAKQLFIKPFDKSTLKEIERSINEANIGISPTNNGEFIILTVPDLTEDRRREYVKQVKSMAEDGKVALRNIRQDANNAIKKLELPEDQEKGLMEDVQELINKYNVIMVVSQPDKEKDRKGNIIYSPCKEIGIKNNIEVYQPIKIREEYQYILDKRPDIIITAAYGQIIPSQILDYPKYGCINVHGSLLPKLRGGAPIHHAIINGDKEAGVTIMYMDKKMDSGDIISQRSINIDDNMILDDLYYKLSILGRDLLIDTLPSILNGTNNRIKQNEEEVTYGLNITKEEELINFNDSVSNVHNKIRGLSSIPGAYAMLNNKRMKIYLSEKTNNISKEKPGTITDINKNGITVSTKDYDIILKNIKLEGKNRCDVKDFINGIKKENFIGGIFNE